MTYACTSPTATTEEDWINDMIAKSAPLTTCNSRDCLNLEFGLYFPSNLVKEDDLFSHTLSNCTASSSPPTLLSNEPLNSVKDLSLLDSVSSKLESMQKNHSLTPKALELIFNTKDVLKDSSDWMLHGQHHKSCAKKLACASKKRKPRRRSSVACKRDHYKIDKRAQCCELQVSTAQTSPQHESAYGHLTPQIASQVTSQVNSALQSKVVSRSNSVSDILLVSLIDPVSESPETETNESNDWNDRFDYAFGCDDAVVFPPVNPDNDDLMKLCMVDFNA